MSDAVHTSYDDVPYASNPFRQSHPDQLATLATLFGMSPRPIDQCRVLELGCASGGNLIPMAESYPESTFVGIDLSSRQVADGQKVIQTLGLKNVELKALSILDVSEEFGQFDYVISHGVYSWVPAPVQEKILEICRRNTGPQGVAYVSYNTYPGWHMRGMIRDMMLYHAKHFADPRTKVAQSRALLDFLAKAAGKESGPYPLLLNAELELLRKLPDSYLLHEHLEENNEPVYFHQFIERARAKGLRYLGEAELGVMVLGNFPADIEKAIKLVSPDMIHTEQYMDFVRHRTFRQTLLCHQEVTPKYNLEPRQLAPFHVASPAKPSATPVDLASPTPQTFSFPGTTATMSSKEPVVKAALLCLGEIWPQAIPFSELRQRARSRLPAQAGAGADAADQDTQHIGQALLTAYASLAPGLVGLSLEPPRFTVKISERPSVTAYARFQAATGHQATNRRHELAKIEEFTRQVMLHLDGTRDRSALVDVLVGLCAKDVLRVHQDGKLVTDPERLRKIMPVLLDQQLSALAKNAFLVS
jgi:methyltransferase-like protein/SAM-dependent methyltransferase